MPKTLGLSAVLLLFSLSPLFGETAGVSGNDSGLRWSIGFTADFVRIVDHNVYYKGGLSISSAGGSGFGDHPDHIEFERYSNSISVILRHRGGSDWMSSTITTYYLIQVGGPSFTLNSAPTALNWSNSQFALTVSGVSDNNGPGIASWKISVDGVESVFNAGTGYQTSFTNPSSGLHQVVVTVTDTLGLQASQSLSLKYDSVPPTTTVATYQSNSVPYSPGNWTNLTPRWTVENSDPGNGSGVASASNTIYGGLTKAPFASLADFNAAVAAGTLTPVTALATNPVTPGAIASGYYALLTKVTDNAGNALTTFSAPYQFDATSPVVNEFKAELSVDGTQLNLSWRAVDDLSGVVSQELNFSQDGSSSFSPVPSSIVYSAADGLYHAAMDLTGYYGAELRFSLAILDRAGNGASADAVFAVPARLLLSLTTGSMDAQLMNLAVGLGVAPSQAAAYRSIRISRTAKTGNVTLPDLVVTPAQLDEEGGAAVYHDGIDVLSGAGNKVWDYKIVATDPMIPPLSSFPNVRLPVHQGTVAMTIADSNGAVYGDPATGADFGKDASRLYTIGLQASGADRDDWNLSVVNLKSAASSGYAVGQSVPLTGNAPVAYPYGTGYAKKSFVVTLNEGVNNIGVQWTQGAGGLTSPVYQWTFVSVQLIKKPSGGYSVSVTDLNGGEVPSDANVIVTRPGLSVNFSLSPSNGGDLVQATVEWNFHDTTDVQLGTNVQHAFAQAPQQSEDHYQYNVEVRVSDAEGDLLALIPLTVVVEDTVSGTLAASEVWNGPHTVIGVVVVPAGMNLTIGDLASVPTKVEFTGGFGMGFGQGLLIQGSLKIKDGVVLAKNALQTQGWGSIKVTGSADIGAVEIRDASTAVAAAPGSTVVLTGTTLAGNRTGLHVVGDGAHSPVVTLSGVTITANTLYGIKEDSGGRPVLSNSSVTGNKRNYYSYDQGLLDIANGETQE